MGPLAKKVLAPRLDLDRIDLSILSLKELECWQLNAQVSYYLISVSSYDVHDVTYEEYQIDTHLILEKLKELYGLAKCVDQEQIDEKSLEECSTFSTIDTNPQVSGLNDKEGQKK